ncbi:hypothetical protein T484DRAFT_1779139 [Baffinella frigidus]|nr:hypothetical protein T484DRAFT_1779139 [Cryptophyta sp. CCMP2293]
MSETNSIIVLTNSIIVLTNSIVLLTNSIIVLTNSIIVSSLEKEHACYVAPGGRINVSSLTESAAGKVASAVVSVLK